MKKILLLGAGLILAACQPGSEGYVDDTGAPINPSPAPTSVWVGRDAWKNDVSKFCDEGRAVYIADAYSGVAMAVIADAAECKTD